MVSSPVKCVEDYIENTKGTKGEYLMFVPTGIPASHFWWSEKGCNKR